MLKLKIGILLSVILLLTGCYNVNQKVTKLTAADDLITALKQDEYLISYDSIDAIEINERLEIGKELEIFILHTLLVKDAKIAEGETQNQLMLLYAIHNPTKKTAIDMWTNLHLHTESNVNTSDKSVQIDMCEIKPGLFCKLRQSPYKIQIATLELPQELVDRLYKEEKELEVIFEYVTEENAAELFVKGLKSSYPPNDIKSITKKLTLNLIDPDDQSKSFD